MTHTYNMLAVSRMPKGIANNDNFFSRKIVIFCGDPRQTSQFQKHQDLLNSAIKFNLLLNTHVIRKENNP